MLDKDSRSDRITDVFQVYTDKIINVKKKKKGNYGTRPIVLQKTGFQHLMNGG